jgi:hypothetical protein
MKVIALTLIFASAVLANDCAGKFTKDCPPTTNPVWPNQFEQEFVETFTYPLVGSGTSKGKFFYDWTNKVYRVDRDNGKWDRYCGTIYPLRSTACSHIVSEGIRYLYFPEKNYCCNCCSNENGCGLLKPDWLSTANFVEYVTEENGTIFEKWSAPGLQTNLYYASAKDRTPRRIDQQPIDIQEFDVNTYNATISDPSVFNLPKECSKDSFCPFLSICTVVRKNTMSKFMQ